MPEEKNSFPLAQRVRDAARALKVFRFGELTDAVDVRTYAEKKCITGTLRDLVRAGEIQKIAAGHYAYSPKAKPRTKQDVIWHLVRSNRRFDVEEIERLSGAARATVREYLQCLTRLGILRKNGREWQLVKDPGPETPINRAKCLKLKAIRKRNAEDAAI